MSSNSSILGQEVTYNADEGTLVRNEAHGHGPGGGGGGGGGGGTPSPTPEIAPGSNLEFNLIWDSSVANAGSNETAFMTAVEHVAYYYSSLFTTSHYVTTPTEIINIQVGWGEAGGSTLSPGALGESLTQGYLTNWSTVTSHLPGYNFNATNEPTAAQFFISSAEAKGYGLITGNAGAVDGAIGFGTGVSWYFGSSNSTGLVTDSTGGQYLFASVAQHEISEVMGRIEMEGATLFNGKPTYTPLDLFNFTSYDNIAGDINYGKGTLALSAGASGGTSYFSIDGGATKDGYFNDGYRGGDIADWASYPLYSQSETGLPSGTQDAYDAFGYSSSTAPSSDLSLDDYYVFETLGVSPTGTAIG